MCLTAFYKGGQGPRSPVLFIWTLHFAGNVCYLNAATTRRAIPIGCQRSEMFQLSNSSDRNNNHVLKRLPTLALLCILA